MNSLNGPGMTMGLTCRIHRNILVASMLLRIEASIMHKLQSLPLRMKLILFIKSEIDITKRPIMTQQHGSKHLRVDVLHEDGTVVSKKLESKQSL